MNSKIITKEIAEVVIQKACSMGEKENLEGGDLEIQLELIDYIVYLTLNHVKKAFYEINPDLAARMIKARPPTMITSVHVLIYQKILIIAERENLEVGPELDWLFELSDFTILKTLEYIEKVFQQVDAGLADQITQTVKIQIEENKKKVA